MRRLARRLLPMFPAVIALVSTEVPAAPNTAAHARSLLQPYDTKTLAGEVMSVDREKRILVIRVINNGTQVRDISLGLDDRTVLKKLRTPISGGELTPGHLVTVTYSEHEGKLVARRIEVTGRAVHQPMP